LKEGIMISLKSSAELDLMRESNRMLAEIMAEVLESVRPGIATRELDQMAATLIRNRGARSAFKGYRGYPATICASVDEGVVHGIPNEIPLEEGNILSIDLGLRYNNYFADIARTIPVGKVSEQSIRLIEAARGAFFAGFERAQPGGRIGDISHAVETYAVSKGYSVVRDFVGHGIGIEMHEEPQVPNFGMPDTGSQLRPGMTIAIEPMVNMGRPEIEVLSDRWTVVTRDRLPSAHYENTVAITEDGPEILTVLATGELL